jgi:hypothetical protein
MALPLRAARSRWRLARRQLRLQSRIDSALRRARRAERAFSSRRRDPGDTELIAAVRRGDSAEVTRRVLAGEDVNVRNSVGQTALHLAAIRNQPEMAAVLLTYGADHELADTRGRRPLALDNTDVEILHAIRQHYQRYRYESVQRERSADEVVTRCVAELAANGIVRLGGVDPALLGQLQSDFATFVAELEQKLATGETGTGHHYDDEAYYWSEDKAYITNNAFKHSAALAQYCRSGRIADIARLYLGKPAFIQRANAMRYLPWDSTDHHMFRYHHDLVDRRLKVMILLTDVGPQDQFMSYVMGSHALFHPYEMFLSNPAPLEYCKRQLGDVRIFETTGSAGDVFLFDSNGAHKGNRRKGARTRDAIFVEYSAARSPQFGGDIPPEVLERAPLTDIDPLHVMVDAPKVWEQGQKRSGPSWIVDLPKPERWVWNPPGSPTAAPAAHSVH